MTVPSSVRRKMAKRVEPHETLTDHDQVHIVSTKEAAPWSKRVEGQQAWKQNRGFLQEPLEHPTFRCDGAWTPSQKQKKKGEKEISQQS